MTEMILQTIVCNMMGTNCYIFGDEVTKEIVIIDPGGEPLAIKRRIENSEFKVITILITHGHPDHTGAAKTLSEELGNIPIMYNRNDLGMAGIRDAQFIKEPDIIEVGSEKLHVLDAPGHSPGGIMFVSYENKIIFTGDTIFRGSIGRTDLGGDYDQLMATIKNKIMYNPQITDEFTILPGHMDESTVGNERRTNMFRRDFL